jgi:biotin operon repressor
LSNERKVFKAIQLRGTRPFTGAAIADEAGLCRQTVYKIIGKLNEQGHRIEGEPRLGFMARLNEAAVAAGRVEPPR